jgi:hypothetical protein
MALSRGASRIGLRFSAGALTILTLTGATSVGVPGFVWMGQVTEGNALFVYGAKGLARGRAVLDRVQSQKENDRDDLYEDIPGAKVGDRSHWSSLAG